MAGCSSAGRLSHRGSEWLNVKDQLSTLPLHEPFVMGVSIDRKSVV